MEDWNSEIKSFRFLQKKIENFETLLNTHVYPISLWCCQNSHYLTAVNTADISSVSAEEAPPPGWLRGCEVWRGLVQWAGRASEPSADVAPGARGPGAEQRHEQGDQQREGGQQQHVEQEEQVQDIVLDSDHVF